MKLPVPLLNILVSAALLPGLAAAADVPDIIFDSDMSSDHDDVADLATLEALADLGECNILACMASSQNGGSALYMNVVNTYFGRPDIPCGRRPDAGGPGGYPGQIANEFPHPLYKTYTDPPLACDLYRKVLAAAKDHSVAIVTTGFFNNLQALMQSGPDAVSPMNGMDLIRAKVRLLSCAAGCYPKGDEFNFRVEPLAANFVITNWPVAAVYDGYDVGQSIYSGAGLEKTANNPIRRGFELTFFGPYPTWGQLMVHYAVRTAESQDLWDYHRTGHNNVDTTGHNWWSEDGDRNQAYMLEIERAPIQQTIETLVMHSAHPKCQGSTTVPDQPTDLRAKVISNHEIDLQWTDNAWDETGFVIERKINHVFEKLATTAAHITSYTDTDLSSTGRVAYRVRALNAHGESTPVALTVYADGWTQQNLTHPDDTSPIYHVYQYDNLNWVRGPNICEHIAINNDSASGQDLAIHVKVGGQGSYGSYCVYFLYQDHLNWYRLNAGAIAEKKLSRFEKCVNGTITQIGGTGPGVNIGNGSMMQTWEITVAHDGAMTYRNNDNPKGNALPDLHDVVSAHDDLAFTHGKIALGSDDGQPVWDDFSFDTAVEGTQSASAPATKP